MKKILPKLIYPLLFLLGPAALADLPAALRNMDNPDNPLMLMKTSRGDIYMELFSSAAPNNVANFIALAEGRAELVDPVSGRPLQQPYYDGLSFQRVIPGTLIQTGAPATETAPVPVNVIADEINAAQFGLDRVQAFDAAGKPHPWLNISSKADLEREILVPLYRRQRIASLADLSVQEYEILDQLKAMSILDVYQNQGYRYSSTLASRRPLRGSVVMANSGPDSNRSEFFINVTDTPWLAGRNTVIGQVVDGLLIADRIQQVAAGGSNSSFSNTTIYEIRQVAR